MDTSKFIITTRPEIKFKPVETECIGVLNIPLTDIRLSDFDKKIADEIAEEKPNVIVLTSSVGASEFFKHYYKYTENPYFIAIGEKTAEVIGKYTGNIEVPTSKDSYGVLEILSERSHGNIALFRSNESNNIIRDSLSRRGIKYHEYYIYKVLKLENTGLKASFLSEKCIGIFITSSMEAKAFKDHVGISTGNKKFYSIGKTTTETLESMGYRVCATGKSDFESMIKYIDKINCQ